MKCVILQPSYIPWRGYFHQIALADVFVFYDDVQYDARGWRNRNKIKTPSGSRWITVPVHSKGSQTEHIPINQIRIDWTKPWNDEHWATLKHNYAKAPFFSQFADILQDLYSRKPEKLMDLTIPFTKIIAEILGFHPTFLLSSQLQASGSKTDHLISILKILGADHYISGPSASDYIDPEQFHNAGITLEYMQYNYPDYPQLYPPFDGQVSILDLLFMTGSAARDNILGKEND
jgi:hypothetical protein